LGIIFENLENMNFLKSKKRTLDFGIVSKYGQTLDFSKSGLICGQKLFSWVHAQSGLFVFCHFVKSKLASFS
jgi:hypothetical protein